MARKKDPEDKRCFKISIRLTEEEYDEFKLWCHMAMRPMAEVAKELVDFHMATERILAEREKRSLAEERVAAKQEKERKRKKHEKDVKDAKKKK